MSSTEIPAPFESTLTVKSDWLDANGHMNVAYYLRAFDDGGEVFFRDCGIGWDYTHEGVGTIFIADCDLAFRRELFSEDLLKIETTLIDWAPKLVHTYQALYHRQTGELAASAEMLFMHIAFADRKSTVMPARTQTRLGEIAKIHRALPRPNNLGRKIEIKRSHQN
ncbi:MAG: acyl-CoA thioester hydrolase [Gammaproteobacteria bacterium]|jgi:acyl-CoA thioester hydrolase